MTPISDSERCRRLSTAGLGALDLAKQSSAEWGTLLDVTDVLPLAVYEYLGVPFWRIWRRRRVRAVLTDALATFNDYCVTKPSGDPRG